MQTRRDKQIDAFADDDLVVVDVARSNTARKVRPPRMSERLQASDLDDVFGATEFLSDIADILYRPQIDAEMFRAIQRRLASSDDLSGKLEFRLNGASVSPLVESFDESTASRAVEADERTADVCGHDSEWMQRALRHCADSREPVAEYASVGKSEDRRFVVALPIATTAGAAMAVACTGSGSLERGQRLLAIAVRLIEFRLSAEAVTEETREVLAELVATHKLLDDAADSSPIAPVIPNVTNLYLEAPIIMLVVDSQGSIQHASQYALKTLGYRETDIVGHNAAKLYRRATDTNIVLRLSQCLTKDELTHLHNCGIRRADGSWLQVREYCKAVDDGHLFLVVLQDVTDTYRRSRELEYRATHDALTGLVNRVEFESRLADAIRSVSVDGASHTLCYLDIDHFKGVNDSLGHGAGDEMLRQIARLFVSHIRQSDTIARLGGDEFAVLMEFCTLENAQRLADDLRQAVDAFSFEWQGRRFSTSISIGLTTIDNKDDNVSAALARADNACYSAKESGRNQVSINSSDRMTRSYSRDHPRVGVIESALIDDRFLLEVQTAVPVAANKRIDGGILDMTLRLPVDDGEILSDQEFRPTAIRYGISHAVDVWMIDRCVREIAARKKLPSYTPRTVMNLRLSADSVNDEELITTITQKLRDYDVDAHKLCLSCSESIVTTSPGVAQNLIRDAHRAGLKFAINDFGSGIAAFELVRGLQVDYCWISSKLVAGIDSSDIDLAILNAVVGICRVAGVTTIVPDVNRRGQLVLLQDSEVDYVQGDSVAPIRPFNSAIVRA